MIVIRPPTKIDINYSKVSIFLGGTIDMGNSRDWQQEFCDNFIKYSDVEIYNPRRIAFNTKDIEEQILWERRAQNLAVYKVYNFEPGSASPITFLELGEYGQSRNTFVRCNKDFYRYDNIRIFCAENNIYLFDSLEELISAIKNRLEI